MPLFQFSGGANDMNLVPSKDTVRLMISVAKRFLTHLFLNLEEMRSQPAIEVIKAHASPFVSFSSEDNLAVSKRSQKKGKHRLPVVD